MFHGLPSAPCDIPDSLHSIPTAQYDTKAQSSAGAVKSPSQITKNVTTPVSESQSSKKNRSRRHRPKKYASKTEPEENEDCNEAGPEMDFDKLTIENGAVDDALPWSGFAGGSSDSEFSDIELGSTSTASRVRVNSSRVRLSALSCFHSLIKVSVC